MSAVCAALALVSTVILPVSRFTVSCIFLVSPLSSPFTCFSRPGYDSSKPSPIPGGIQRPTSSANTLDGELISKASLAASNKLFAKFLTLSVNQLQPEEIPFQIPVTMLLPIVAIWLGKPLKPFTILLTNPCAAEDAFDAKSAANCVTLVMVLTRCVHTLPGSCENHSVTLLIAFCAAVLAVESRLAPHCVTLLTTVTKCVHTLPGSCENHSVTLLIVFWAAVEAAESIFAPHCVTLVTTVTR